MFGLAAAAARVPDTVFNASPGAASGANLFTLLPSLTPASTKRRKEIFMKSPELPTFLQRWMVCD